jgi:outer membrane protein assembly factor BamB
MVQASVCRRKAAAYTMARMGHVALIVVGALLAIDGMPSADAVETGNPWSRWRGHNAAGVRHLLCDDLTTGARVWSREGQFRWHVDLGPFAAEHGFGGTPTVCSELVIVPLEQDGPGLVIGIDAMTGKERWRLPRDGVDKAAYLTPLVITTAAGAAVICTSHGRDGNAASRLSGE